MTTRRTAGDADDGTEPSPGQSRGLLSWAMELLSVGNGRSVDDDLADVIAEIGRRAGAARVAWIPRSPDAGAVIWTAHRGADPASRIPVDAQTITRPVVADGVPFGALTVLVGAGPANGGREQDVVAHGADIVALILRGAHRRRTRELQESHSVTTSHALDLVRAQLSSVFADERRRLVHSLLSATDGAVDDLIHQLTEFEEAIRRHDVTVTTRLACINEQIDQLVTEFRHLAHGTYPLALRAEGPAGAITQLGRTLRHRLVPSGDTRVRAGWEVESSLYWALSAVIRYVDGWAIDGPIQLRWQRSRDELEVRVIVVVADGHDDRAHHRLLHDLRVEIARFDAFGGKLSVGFEGLGTCVSLRLPLSSGSAGVSPFPRLHPPGDAAGWPQGSVETLGDGPRPGPDPASPSNLDAFLARTIEQALGAPSEHAADHAITELATLAQAMSGAAMCIIEQHDSRGNGRWQAGESEVAAQIGRTPRRIDLSVVCRGRHVGSLRLEGGTGHDEVVTSTAMAAIAACTAVLLTQRLDRRAAVTLWRRTLEAQTEIMELRRTTATELERVRQDFERDLHDGAQAELASLRMQLGLLEHVLAQADQPTERILSLAAVAVARARAVRERIKSAASGVAPAVLHQQGLAEALRTQLPSLPQPGRLQLDVDATVESRRFPEDVELTAYFVCLEAVTNSTRHAPGADVVISLQSTARGLAIHVHDTGPGFDPAAAPGALRAIRQRTREADGDLTIWSSPRHGTAITVVLPY